MTKCFTPINQQICHIIRVYNTINVFRTPLSHLSYSPLFRSSKLIKFIFLFFIFSFSLSNDYIVISKSTNLNEIPYNPIRAHYSADTIITHLTILNAHVYLANPIPITYIFTISKPPQCPQKP